MGKNGEARKLNMKVAGTLGNYLDQKVNTRTGELVDPKTGKAMIITASPAKSERSIVDSEGASVMSEIDKEKYKSMTK